MNEEKYFLTTVLAFIFCCISVGVGSSIHDNYTMLQMVAEGASPFEASCAVKDSAGDNSTCVQLIQAGVVTK